MPEKDDLPVLEKITLRGYTLDLDKYLKADYSDISHAAAELPAVMEWINECLHDLREGYNILKTEVDEVEAKAYFELTSPGEQGFEQNYHGKQTADALNRAVTLDTKVAEKKRSLARQAAWCQRLAGIQQSLQAKLDLTRSSESTRRTVFGRDDAS